MKLVERLAEYERIAKGAVEKARELTHAEQQLAEVQSGVGATGGLEQSLKQTVEWKQAELGAQVSRAEELASELISSYGAK